MEFVFTAYMGVSRRGYDLIHLVGHALVERSILHCTQSVIQIDGYNTGRTTAATGPQLVDFCPRGPCETFVCQTLGQTLQQERQDIYFFEKEKRHTALAACAYLRI
jgi:hypothetical protein